MPYQQSVEGAASAYSKTYNSFAGTDIVASVTIPGIGTSIFGTLQTVSYSIHRDKFPARTLGRISPKGYSYGGRTIAGSLIFTVFDRHVLKYTMEGILKRKHGDFANLSVEDKAKYSELYYSVLTDEIPPFDINIIMANEHGQAAKIDLLGIMITDEGQVMSVEDIMTENTMSFIARDIVPLAALDKTLITTEGEDRTETDWTSSHIHYPWS